MRDKEERVGIGPWEAISVFLGAAAICGLSYAFFRSESQHSSVRSSPPIYSGRGTIAHVVAGNPGDQGGIAFRHNGRVYFDAGFDGTLDMVAYEENGKPVFLSSGDSDLSEYIPGYEEARRNFARGENE